MISKNKIKKLSIISLCLFLLLNSTLNADTQYTGQTTLNSTGNIWYVPNGAIATIPNSTVNVNNGAILEIRSGGTLNGFGAAGASNFLMNLGSNVKVMPGGTINTGYTLFRLFGSTLSVFGTINIPLFNGRINTSFSGATPGKIELYPSGIINISGTGSPAGEIDTDSGIFYNYGGILNISERGFFQNASGGIGGTLNQFAGTTNINCVDDPSIGLVNGMVSAAVTNVSGGVINVNAGRLINGRFGIGTINLSGTGQIKVLGGTFYNGGGAGYASGSTNVRNFGTISLFSGSTINGHASSAITVFNGGSIYNYYGIINTNLGSLEIKPGGKLINIRGNRPSSLTLNTGCTFVDSNEIYLSENISLDSAWTITNKIVINGQGHIITFTSSNGAIRIAKRASLLLRDVVIQNVSANQIRCLDTYSTLSLDKCTWLLDGNYSFTKGRMYIAGDWNIVGNNRSFSYQSRKESSIAEDANLNLIDTTFIYDINISNTLFNPLSSKSNIFLQNSTLQASQSWQPGAGTLLTSGNVTLNGIATLDLQNISNIKNHGSIMRLGTVLM